MSADQTKKTRRAPNRASGLIGLRGVLAFGTLLVLAGLTYSAMTTPMGEQVRPAVETQADS